MNYQTHNQTDRIDTNRTHLLEVLENLPYWRITECFGEPLTGDFDKVQAEWEIQFDDGLIGTIYDWKECTPYQNVEEWHIGGHDWEVAERIKHILLGE